MLQERDYSDMIREVREKRNNLPDETKREMLQVPLAILNSGCELNIDTALWVQENGRYFASNCVGLSEWRAKFESEDFELADIARFMEDIMADKEALNSDFCLRNPEVTLRYYVRLKR